MNEQAEKYVLRPADQKAIELAMNEAYYAADIAEKRRTADALEAMLDFMKYGDLR